MLALIATYLRDKSGKNIRAERHPFTGPDSLKRSLSDFIKAFIMKNFLATNGIPKDLKQHRQWILWKRGEDKGNGRFGKQPCDSRGYPTSATNPENWLSYDQAIQQLNLNPKAAGLGFCLSGKPLKIAEGERYLVGIDLDECVTVLPEDEGVRIDPQSSAILDCLNTYTELSPSRTGVRAFFYSEELPRGQNRNGREIYGDGRFLTVTGFSLFDDKHVRHLSAPELGQLLELMYGNPAGAKNDSRKPADGGETGSVTEKWEETAAAVEQLKAALSSLPAHLNRAQWVRAVLSIKAHGFSCAEQLARDWSKSAGPFDPVNNRCGYEESAFNDVWKTSPTQITPATLYYLAKQYADKKVSISYGDTFNGQVFAELNRGRLKYVYPAGKWIFWDEKRWNWCSGGEALEAAKATAQEILRRAAEDFQCDPSNAEAKRKLSHAQQSFNLKRLEPMLVCAAAEEDMHVTEMSELDSNPMLLGCKNGVVDLRTGQLLWPQREMLITKQVDAAFHPDMPCPQWERFLSEIMLRDVETIDYMQKGIGYTLTGNVSEELMHFFYGKGRNGKSVLANIICRLFNDYAVVAPAEMLMQRDRGGGANNDVARLVGARLLLANETRSGQALDDLSLKTLVSTEKIAARFLHREYFEFRPTHHIWMRGNHKPLVRDESEGAWRRIRLLPFELDLSAAEVDPTLEEKLWAERDGILSWAVRGCQMWQREGLEPSPRIRAASAGYRKDCDLFGEFIDEECVLDKSARVSQRILWLSYQSWCFENGVKSGSKKSFTRRLEDRGVISAGWEGKERLYTGVRKRTPEEQAEAQAEAHRTITGSVVNSSFPPREKFLREKPGTTPTSCDSVVEEVTQ